nr:MAG TPA: hypothetical protein [Caudoviricetes sp.]
MSASEIDFASTFSALVLAAQISSTSCLLCSSAADFSRIAEQFRENSSPIQPSSACSLS